MEKKKQLIFYIAVASVGILAIIAIILSIKAIKIAEKRPVSLEQIAIRSNDIEFADDISFAGERVPLEMFNIRERYERELLSTCYFHSNTMLLVKRSKRWFPVIEPILKKYGVPDDFKYLCVTESTLTNAVSPAGAVGFWQFLERTGKEFGLTINKDVDMRYNVELETEAACRYFLKSYEIYHNWTLVAASFNAGIRRLNKFLKEQKVNSYYDLLMADETERYIFRILAFKTILENPEQYGIYVSKSLEYKPFRYKTVVVRKSVDSWADFAKKHDITYKLLKIFNPWLRSNSLKVRKGEVYEIKIPLRPFNLTADYTKEATGGEIMEFDVEEDVIIADSIN
ncbi:MAG: lytic transglycosylase domain-containing protein [Bacteroidales bacterium]|nr:lytic transglycosylase domain-containing protein [Bacteroidales bacterium]